MRLTSEPGSTNTGFLYSKSAHPERYRGLPPDRPTHGSAGGQVEEGALMSASPDTIKEKTVTPTWKELRESLGDGISDETLELIRRATAQQRHEARIMAARQAALEATDDLRLAGVLCALEANGHGGPLEMGRHLGARATLRAEWARGLGSGRANARDGQAWNAAIRAAAQEMLRDNETWEDVAPTAQDVVDLLDRITDSVVLEEARAYARSRIYEAARNGHDPAPAVREWDRVIRTVAERMVPAAPEAVNNASS
jgi:hypothetical protein